MNDFSPEEELRMRDTLKRCPTGAIEAAVSFRKTGDRSLVPLILMGVLERFVERDLRPKLRSGDLTLRLAEDLAMDSLTMLETVMLLEEMLLITIDNEELKPLRTLGDVDVFVGAKLSASAHTSASTVETNLSGTAEWTGAESCADYLGRARLGKKAKSAARE